MLLKLIKAIGELLKTNKPKLEPVFKPNSRRPGLDYERVLEHLKSVAANKTAIPLEDLAKAMCKYLPAYEIDTEERFDMFIAQIAHETAGFRYITELGSRSYFNRYEGRKDLGNTKPGDGYKYRGRGLIQLTGRSNYTQFRDYLYKEGHRFDVVEQPDLITQLPHLSLLTALWYWESRNLNRFADRGDMRGLTMRINGGLNGFQDRINRWKKLVKIKLYR